MAPPRPQKKARIPYTPLSVRTANAVKRFLEQRDYDAELEPMLDRDPGVGSQAELFVYVVGSAVRANAVRAHAEAAREQARRGSYVLVCILPRIDEESAERSMENRREFSNLAREWAAAEYPGWQDNLAVVSVGGISEVLRAIERREGEIGRASERRKSGVSPLADVRREPAGPGYDLPKGHGVRITTVLQQPDRLGLMQRLTRQWEEHRFSADEISLSTLDGEAVGHFSGCLPDDVTEAQAQAFCEALQRTLKVPDIAPTVGVSAGFRVRFASSQLASAREVVVPKLPNVSGRLAGLLDAISSYGGNVAKIDLAPDGGGDNPTTRLSLRFELGFIPPEQRIQLYAELRALKGYRGLKLYHVSGTVSTAEGRHLDRRPVSRSRRTARRS